MIDQLQCCRLGLDQQGTSGCRLVYMSSRPIDFPKCCMGYMFEGIVVQACKKHAPSHTHNRQTAAFYTFAKRFKAPVSSVRPLLDSKDKLQSYPAKMGAILQEQYSRAFSNPNEANLSEVRASKVVDEPHAITDIDLNEQDILDSIKSMNRSSAAGPDKFQVAILKECGHLLAPVITQLWRASRDSGDIASKFKSQSDIPLFKKGKGR